MSDGWREVALVGAGGFFGAAGRFLVSGWIGARAQHFPYGTLAVNLIGSLALGFLVTLLAERVFAGGAFRLLALVGFLGRSPPSRRSATRRCCCGRAAAGRRCAPTSA